jgi:hypothetical protein
MPDLDTLTDEQLDDLVFTLATFAAWLARRKQSPDEPPFAAYAQAALDAGGHHEAAVDFVSTAQAALDAGRKPRLFRPDEE